MRRINCAGRLIKGRVQLKRRSVQIGQIVARNAQGAQIGLGGNPRPAAVNFGRIDHGHIDFTDLDNWRGGRRACQKLGPDIGAAHNQLIHADLAIIRQADGLVL